MSFRSTQLNSNQVKSSQVKSSQIYGLYSIVRIHLNGLALQASVSANPKVSQSEGRGWALLTAILGLRRGRSCLRRSPYSGLVGYLLTALPPLFSFPLSTRVDYSHACRNAIWVLGDIKIKIVGCTQNIPVLLSSIYLPTEGAACCWRQ